MQNEVEKKCELKIEVLGPDAGQCREMRVVNRMLRWTNGGVDYEADPRHMESVRQQRNIGACKPVARPVTKEEGRAKPDDRGQSRFDEKLGEQKHAIYRALVARANYMSPDRPDIAFAVKELSRSMSAPTVGDRENLRRLERYRKGMPRVVKKFRWQKPMRTLSL